MKNSYLIGEVLFNNFVSKFVDLDVFVVLQALDLVQAATLFDHSGDHFQVTAG